MNAPDPHWRPDAQLLAAYFDGELEGRAEVADLRARIEAWIESHPEAVEEWQRHRKLQQLWLDTTPAPPSAEAWARTRDAIDAERREPGKPNAGRNPWLAIVSVVAGVALAIGGFYGASYLLDMGATPPPVLVERPKGDAEELEIFEVARADEVTILRVAGEGTDALVVGVLPLDGPMELAATGEVRVVEIRTQPGELAPANVHPQGRHRPMIWTPAGVE